MGAAASKERPPRGTASERIITTAIRLLIEDRGHLEIDRLAEAADCSTGAIYHHYGSKAGLLAAVVARYNEAVAKLVAPATVPANREAWRSSLVAAVEATVGFMWNDPLTLVIVEETIKDASAASETERWLRVHVASLTAHLVEAQAAGHLPADRDPEVLAAGIAGGLRQIMRVFVVRTKRPAFATVLAEVWSFVGRQLGVAEAGTSQRKRRT